MFFFDLEFGGVILAYKEVEEDNYHIQATDYVLSVNNGAVAWSIFLPTHPITGTVYIIKRYRNSTGVIIITTPFQATSIESTTGTLLPSINLAAWGNYSDRMMFMYNGTYWEYVK